MRFSAAFAVSLGLLGAGGGVFAQAPKGGIDDNIAPKAPKAAAAAHAAIDDGIVVLSLSSSDRLIADMKHIVVSLAKEQKAWDDIVLPNIEIWLFGVDRTLPVGLDVVFDPAVGRRLHVNVPIEDPTQFLEDNLHATGINTKPIPGKKDLYKLSDVQEGFLRFLGDPLYATISKIEAEVPANMPSPKGKLDAALEGGYGAALSWHATAETRDKRIAGFDKLKQNLLEAVKKRPTETNAAYELRRLAVEQQADRFARLLTNTAELKAGWITDSAKNKYSGHSTMTGLPDSLLSKDIAAIGTEKSKFAKVPDPEKSALIGRILMPVNEQVQADQKNLYEKWLTVWKERIDERKEASAENKAARKEMADHVQKMLISGLGIGWVDAFVEMTPSGPDYYTGVAGVRVADSAEILPILELLPKITDGWKVELNAGEESGTKLHRLDLKAKLPSSLKDAFGDSGLVIVGTGPQTLWIASGPDAEAKLKAALAAASGDGAETAVDPVSMKMQLRPVLKFLTAFFKDEDIEIVQSLNQSRMAASEDRSSRNNKDEADRRVSRDALKNFKWQDAAVEALAGGDDGFTLVIKKEDTALVGDINAETGVARAVGKIVAKFMSEVLK